MSLCRAVNARARKAARSTLGVGHAACRICIRSSAVKHRISQGPFFTEDIGSPIWKASFGQRQPTQPGTIFLRGNPDAAGAKRGLPPCRGKRFFHPPDRGVTPAFFFILIAVLYCHYEIIRIL